MEGRGLQLLLPVSGGSSFADNNTHPARHSVRGQAGSLRARESLGEQPWSEGVAGRAAERGKLLRFWPVCLSMKQQVVIPLSYGSMKPMSY